MDECNGIGGRFDIEDDTSNAILDDADRRLVGQMVTEAKRNLEILEERRHKVILFVYCLGEDPIPVPQRHSASMPWVLGRVCSRWREISIAETNLWSHVKPWLWNKHTLASLETAIGRFGQLVYIALGPIPYHYFQDTLCLLRHQRQKLKFLSVEIVESTSGLLRGIPSFVHLEALSITYGYGFGPITAISALPALRKLTLTRKYDKFTRVLDDSWIDPTFPTWERLTHLEIARYIGIIPSVMLKILQRCLMIIECSVYLISEARGPEDTATITVPTQELLKLDMSDGLKLAALFALITLPSLKALEIRDPAHWRVPWPQQEFLGFLERSRCHLDKLSIHGCGYMEGSATSLMRSVPNLRHLRIDMGTIANYVVDVMISDVLLPNLESLTTSFVSSHGVMELLRSRKIRRGYLHVHNNNATCNGEGNKDELDALRHLVASINSSIEILYHSDWLLMRG